MAPTAPPRRSAIDSKSASKLPERAMPSHRPNTIASDSFLRSKKDKRTIKHSTFVSRIEKSHSKPLKRRRPNKKLVATLESLGDALDELGKGVHRRSIAERAKEGKIRLRGLKSRPGAMKRREKVERTERERFGRNMAQLVGGAATEAMGSADGETQVKGQMEGNEQRNGTSQRWSALRDFISQTLEQKKEFMTET